MPSFSPDTHALPAGPEQKPPRCPDSRIPSPREETIPVAQLGPASVTRTCPPPHTQNQRPLVPLLHFPECSRADPSPQVHTLVAKATVYPLPLETISGLWQWAPHIAALCPQPGRTSKGVSCSGLAMPGWVSYCSMLHPPHAAPTHSPSGLSGGQGQQESELASSCSSGPSARGFGKHQADGGTRALGL